MLRPSTRQCTDYGARDHAGVGDADDSESRGPEHRALGNDQVSNGEPRSRSSSRESGALREGVRLWGSGYKAMKRLKKGTRWGAVTRL